MWKPHCSIFRVITAIFRVDVQIFSDFYGTYQKEVAPLEVVLSTLEGVASSLVVGLAAVGASGLEDPFLGPHTWVGASNLGVVPWVAFLKHKKLYLNMLWMEIKET